MQLITPCLNTLRQHLRKDFQDCRMGTHKLVASLDETTLRSQAHPDFSPVGWHLGHIAYTESLWILEHLAGLPPQFPQYRRLFAADGLPKQERVYLPSWSELQSYLDTVRQQVLDYLAIAPVDEQLRLWRWLLQHESQHNETISLILELHRRATSNIGQGIEQPVDYSSVSSPSSALQDLLHKTSEEVYIPEGELIMGCEDVDAIDNERPAHTVTLAGYWIDRYPVTNAQYRQFIAMGGYDDRRWWSEAGWQWLQSQADQGTPITRPLYWRDDPWWNDHPVSGVSWYEAEAYARFVGKRLPTEAEWERAALGATAGNYDRRYGSTTPVTAHPAGKSHAGCDDMLGNVWEWTDTWFAGYDGFTAYPYAGYSQAYFDGQHRVLRGGSWATRPWALRITVRNWYYPSVRQVLAGFRCARSA
ncbi:MAG: SUMF1/EgtB/PvdO family nonheme iron enzyme [Cyanobacteria bacterium]|nr:SUMF1/EgtB/PvdO family nonheme iron enzyme [Cyanobacteriota bacterium]MDW8202556.1 SUMF1/EgtB/PvdO family nonheme iron enzyme [Cyanobacteriota bacterium SKYGB_h_bin112]